jgi:hypothetical protein
MASDILRAASLAAAAAAAVAPAEDGSDAYLVSIYRFSNKFLFKQVDRADNFNLLYYYFSKSYRI